MVDLSKHVGTTDLRNNFYFSASSLCRTFLRFTIARLVIYAEKHEKLQAFVAIFHQLQHSLGFWVLSLQPSPSSDSQKPPLIREYNLSLYHVFSGHLLSNVCMT